MLNRELLNRQCQAPRNGQNVAGTRTARRLIALAIAAAALGFAPRASSAEELYEGFVRGLRDRQYYDMALFYLDELAKKPNVPTEIRELIPYEKAVTLLESSRSTKSPDRQLELLDQALAFLAEFIKASPNHAKAADANTERAQILIGKARVEILQSKSPANQAAKGDYQKRARDLIVQARAVFETAAKQHEATWKSFGGYIDRNTDREQYQARGKAETSLIKSTIDLALCTLEEARTYDPGSPDNKRLLGEAATQFEELHQRYRSQVAGLFARVYQGKCFEEMGDLQKALGIYNELLSHPGTDSAMARLKDQTLQFKLISLNTDARRDYQLVADLGSEWLKNNRSEANSRTGVGIRWEVARASEMLGDQRELPKNDAEKNWRRAREEAVTVNRFPGEYKDVSLAMIQRLDVKIGGKERKPDTFDAAHGLGRQMITSIKNTKEKLDGAKRSNQPAEEVQKIQEDLDLQLAQAGEIFDLALRLASPQDDPKSVNQSRYMYAYVNFLQRRNYEAAILGEYVAKMADKEDVTTGLDAAFLSMAAYVQAFNDAKGTTTDKDADMRLIIRSCNLISDRWPDSDRASDARMTLGRMYNQLKQPVEAAKWYGKVPSTDSKYLEAQLAAGQAYWTAYLTLGRANADEGEERPTPEQLTTWRTEAERLLQTGIKELGAKAPKEGAAPPELIAAKMSLSQILISLGKDADAVKLLVDDPQSVVKAITVADESKRPATGIQSRQFATESYKLLLRAYIGSGKLNEARETMKTLEEVAGAAAGADVTELYVGLGKLLREELDRFRDAGETERFNSLMTSFETFLNDLYQRQEGQTFGSLSWIGETYFALGEAAANDPSRSMASFQKAGNAFEEILNKAEANPDFMPEIQVPAVKVRLVRCYRLKKEFEQGEKLIGEILSEAEKDLRAQFEAAHLYQSWGADGEADYYLKAINGNSALKIWGWRNLGIRLQNAVDQGQTKMLPNFVEARLNGTRARHQYALAQTSIERRSEELEKAEIELVATVSVTKGLTDDDVEEFNNLYKQVLSDSGKEFVELKPGMEFESKPLVAATDGSKVKKPVEEEVPANPPPPAPNNVLTAAALGITVLLGLGVAAFIFLKKGKKRAPVVHRNAAVAFSGVTAAAPMPEGPPTSLPTAPRTPRTSSGGAKAAAPKPTGTKPAGTKPSAGGTAARPRTKPPTPPKS